MVVKKLHNYLGVVDSNGDKIGSWAEEAGDSRARCKICSGPAFSIKKGKSNLLQHCETTKHKVNLKKVSQTHKQINIVDSMKQREVVSEKDLQQKQKVQDFEIDLTRRFDSHKVPTRVLQCVVDCIKQHAGGPDGGKVVDQMTLGRTKAQYLAKEGIAKTYLEETICKIQLCDGFSIGFDESEMNKNHECEVMVMVSMKETGIELRHYRTFSLGGTDAKTIVTTVTEQMDDDKINWREKLISPMTDGCATMIGCHAGVRVRLAEVVPQLKDFGTCNDHHLGNAAQAACEALDQDIREALVNIYYDIGGAKGKGLKKKHEYEKIAKEKGRSLKALHKFGSTRFRSYRICIDPILNNWETIVDYYSKVVKPTPRQVKLQKFFVKREYDSKLKLEFIMAATRDLNEAINYFEERTNKIHKARDKMEEVLRCQLLKFLKTRVVNKLDELDNVMKKSGPELLKIDVNDDSKYLSRSFVFIGQQCSKLMKDLELTPSSSQLDKFYELVFRFHKKVASKLQGYFQKGLNSLELQFMASFSPSNRTKLNTADEILYMGSAFSKIVEVIKHGNSQDLLKTEVERYQVDELVRDFSPNLSYNDYWGAVGELTEGEEEWPKYEVLARLARALGSPFNTGSEMERGFSRQSDIVRDPKKNRMGHDALDSHMQIKFGMESEETKQKCPECRANKEISRKDDNEKTEAEKSKEKLVCHCHCKFSEITPEMRSNCSVAWKALKKVPSIEDSDSVINSKVPQVCNAENLDRLVKLKNAIKKRSTLYQPEDMERIFGKEEKKQEAGARAVPKLKKVAEPKLPPNFKEASRGGDTSKVQIGNKQGAGGKIPLKEASKGGDASKVQGGNKQGASGKILLKEASKGGDAYKVQGAGFKIPLKEASKGGDASKVQSGNKQGAGGKIPLEEASKGGGASKVKFRVGTSRVLVARPRNLERYLWRGPE